MQSGFGKFGSKLAVGLVGLGLLVIGLAWNGAAGYVTLVQQFPYLLSGGLIGLSLVIVGSALMVVQASREERSKIEAKLDEVIGALGGGGVGGPAAPSDLTGLVVAGSASYHVPGCRLVDGREEVSYLTPVEAHARFLQPCRICQPEGSNVSVV